ncbi:uncharacterized protein LOC142328309 [Lycorma delicatula]|uniref:uncharacterized protein LOC142328309 n=1 Tax=Lycorma delicatula TaxID=130591 RepID=UPI003F50FFA1
MDSDQESLHMLSNIQVQRTIIPKQKGVLKLEKIHGFADATESAYGTYIRVYLKCIDHDGIITVSLVTLKSRGAPIKKILLPRLELCGALLLYELCKSTVNALQFQVDSISCYTD